MTSIIPGFFISFEGIDGAGKSTHIESFKNLMQERYPGREVVMTREPGGTPLGEQLRALLLDAPMHLETEALLMFAARREHIAQVIGYLTSARIETGLLINFGSAKLQFKKYLQSLPD